MTKNTSTSLGGVSLTNMKSFRLKFKMERLLNRHCRGSVIICKNPKEALKKSRNRCRRRFQSKQSKRYLRLQGVRFITLGALRKRITLTVWKTQGTSMFNSTWSTSRPNWIRSKSIIIRATSENFLRKTHTQGQKVPKELKETRLILFLKKKLANK